MKTRYLYVDGVFEDPIVSEEEKIPHGGKSEGVLDDGKSGVSRITQKTSRGKTSNKHCSLCNFKLVPGPDCSRHCNRHHKGIEVALIKCDATCSHCKGK